MIFSLPAHRHFSVSAFIAVQRLRAHASDYSVDAVTAASALELIDATFAASDVEAGLSLDRLLPSEFKFDDYASSVRDCLSFLIAHHLPWWRSFFPSGRKRVVEALSDSELQLFAHASLLDNIPTPASLEWWYKIQALVRGERDVSQSMQGGLAEIWTLDHERDRLKALGIDLQPELSGFETSDVGYDVKSYDRGPYGPVVRLIEVKSSKSDPPRIVLTRGEWRSAEQSGEAFLFHLWKLPAKELQTITVAEMAPNIPQNLGKGSWQEVEILFT